MATGLAWLLVLVLLLPHLTLLLVSFVPVGTWTTEPLPPAYTIHNYIALLQDPVRVRPLLNSLWLATAATIAALVIGLAGALVASRRRGRSGRVIEGLLALPWAVPGTVFAIALATAFSVRAPWAGASSWSAPSGSFRSPISYGICRSPVARFSPGPGPSIRRWTRRPAPWERGAGAPCAR